MMKYTIYIFFTIFLFTGCTQKKITPKKNSSRQQQTFQADMQNFLESQEKNITQQLEKEDNVQIQGLITDLGVMLGTQMGASMANAELSSQARLLASTINKNNQTIQTNIEGFQTELQKEQQTELQAMMTAFSHAQQDIQSQISQAVDILNLELDYLYKNISISEPQENYVVNQIEYDQLFTLGTMLTPSGPLWKNPFSVGDWEYEAKNNSFWQHQNTPLFRIKTDDAGNQTQSSIQAENNSIFAEYRTNNASYTISGSITVYAVSYPFFVGIIFNKARWISGDFESIRKCRMAGIYGTDENNSNLYFAQQYTMTDDQIQASPEEDPIQTALQQIINQKIQPSLAMPADTFINLATNPVTLYFSITNSPTSVTFNFWTDSHTKNTITVNNLDDEIYKYHGIGFICPGAVAQFTLNQPTDFIFSQQAISNYKD